MSISEKDVAHIAKLARRELTPAETTSLTHDLAEILGYVEKIAAIETGDADQDAGSQPADAPGLGEKRAPAGPPFREDVILPSLPVEVALHPSADHDDSFFRVPPVIAREEG